MWYIRSMKTILGILNRYDLNFLEKIVYSIVYITGQGNNKNIAYWLEENDIGSDMYEFRNNIN
jgi:hypothetical protein